VGVTCGGDNDADIFSVLDAGVELNKRIDRARVTGCGNQHRRQNRIRLIKSGRNEHSGQIDSRRRPLPKSKTANKWERAPSAPAWRGKGGVREPLVKRGRQKEFSAARRKGESVMRAFRRGSRSTVGGVRITGV